MSDFSTQTILVVTMAIASHLACAAEPESTTDELPRPGIHFHDDRNPGLFPRKHIGADDFARVPHRSIDLTEDMVFGQVEGPDVPATSLLYFPVNLTVDAAGRVYVREALTREIVVFNRDGSHERTLGRRGQGPGEFDRLDAVAVAGDVVFASDAVLRRLSVWRTDGSLLGTHLVTRSILNLAGLNDGTVVGRYTGPGFYQHTVARFERDGKALQPYADLVEPRLSGLSVAPNGYLYGESIGRAQPWFAVDPQGIVYLSPGDAYKIFAMRPTKEPLWSLVADWPRVRLSRSEIRRAQDLFVETHSRRSPSINLAEAARNVKWPEFAPALSRGNNLNGRPIRIGPDGDLYVFPYIPFSWEIDDRMRPVHVYGSDGSLRWIGSIRNKSWVTAQDGYVYGIEQRNGQPAVVRYQMVDIEHGK